MRYQHRPYRHTVAASGFVQGAEKHAVDLGCGVGRDSLYLLGQGFHVCAIDRSSQALEKLVAASNGNQRLSVQAGCMAEANIKDAALIVASHSLYFVEPESFWPLWHRIRKALRKDGIFAGHILGDQDGWAAEGRVVSTVKKTEFHRIVEGFDVLDHREVIKPMPMAQSGREKLWHVHTCILRRRRFGGAANSV